MSTPVQDSDERGDRKKVKGYEVRLNANKTGYICARCSRKYCNLQVVSTIVAQPIDPMRYSCHSCKASF
jgi:DNA-directed RNA polymerase subunit RPC12/RpoP